SNSQNTGYIFPRTDDGWAHFIVYLHIAGAWRTLSAPYGALNQWHHLAATWDGTNIRLYKDGVLVATSPNYSGLITSNTNQLTIGQQPGYSEYFGGQLDECRIWNVARTQCDIYTYKDCEIPTSATGLVANYHFNEGVASSSNSTINTLTDASGNANDGTLANFALSGANSNWIAPTGVVSGSVTPLALPNVSYTATNPVVCGSGTTALTASGADTYTWSGGITDGMAFTISSTTSYTVSGTNSVTTCSNTAVATISVGTTPTLSVNSGSICNGASFTISPSGAVSYTIQGGSNVVSPSATTSYTVVGADPLGCVSSVDSSVVTVRPNPTITVNSGAVCAGQSFTITPSGTTSYSIQGGSNVVMPLSNSTYTVVGTDSAGCMSSPVTSSVNVNLTPTITASTNDSLICAGYSATLTAAGAGSYTWNPGAMTGTSITVSPTVTTTYSVVGTSTAGCTGSATLLQNVSVCTGINAYSHTNALGLYPNPSNGEFVIESSVPLTLTVIDQTGAAVASVVVQSGTSHKISLTHLPAGLYSLVGKSADNIYSKRIVIIK
ncbi:MAG: LamG-like jellyroll fold domain-containing protein, partial [Bacteroidia bacterium]